MSKPWVISWDHGTAEVQPMGGMLGPVWYTINGQTIQPFFVAPWIKDPNAKTLPGMLRGLRGEFPCVPFGVEGQGPFAEWEGTGEAIRDDEPHGYGANHVWHLLGRGPDWVEIAIEYPKSHPIRRLKRKIAGRRGEAAVDLDLEIETSRMIDLGFALHATFRLPEIPGTASLDVAGFKRGLTFPAPLDVSGSAEPGTWFDSLTDVSGTREHMVDFSRQPFAEPNEDLLQIEAVGGCVRLLNTEEKWAAQLNYDPTVFPTVVLWVSNRGWTSFPWAGCTRALGIEPTRAAMNLGQTVSGGSANPLERSGIPTSLRISAGSLFKTSYAISVETLA